MVAFDENFLREKCHWKPLFRGRPFKAMPHQLRETARILDNGEGAISRSTRIFAHAMGTGKTITLLILISMWRTFFRNHRRAKKMRLQGRIEKASGARERDSLRVKLRLAVAPRCCVVVVPKSTLNGTWRAHMDELLEGGAWKTRVVESGKQAPDTLEIIGGLNIIVLSHGVLSSLFYESYAWDAEAEETIDHRGVGHKKGAYVVRPGREVHALFRAKLGVLAIDECHLAKNGANKVRLNAACATIGRNAFKSIGLTGTPVCNSPADLCGIIKALGETDEQAIDPKSLQSGGYGTINMRRVAEMREKYISTVSIEAVPLPPKTRTVVSVDALGTMPPMAQALYNEELSRGSAAVRSMSTSGFNVSDNAELIASLNSMKLVLFAHDLHKLSTPEFGAVGGVLPKAVETLRDLLGRHDKIVVSSQFVTVLKRFAKAVSESGSVPDAAVSLFDGSLTIKARDRVVETFMKDPRQRVLLLSMRAGGVGIQLADPNQRVVSPTAVMFLTTDFNPQTHAQAEARVHRQGQTRPVETVYFTTNTQSIETSTFELHQDKEALARAIVHGSPDDMRWASESVTWRRHSSLLQCCGMFPAGSALTMPNLVGNRLWLEPEAEAEAEENDCPICLSAMETTESATPVGRLRCCKNQFHKPCLLKWLEKRITCPLCRALLKM